MKITQFKTNVIPEESLYGLSPKINMNNLGDTVILVGPNGAGKSRILKCIQDVEKNKNIYIDKVKQAQEDIKTKKMFGADLDKIDRLTQEIDEQLPIIIDNKDFSKLKVVSFVPKTTKLFDWRRDSKEKWTEKANNCKSYKIEEFAEGATAFIQQISDNYWNVTHPDYSGKKTEIHQVTGKYIQLKEYIKNFLETELSRDKEGNATLFGKPIADAQLSEGQIILLQLVVAIISQQKNIDDFILLLDEPEAHLHPAAAIKFIEEIKKKLPKKENSCQIWIATHSVAIVSHFKEENIWYINENTVEKGERKIDSILKGLIGKNEDINNLREFTNLPDIYAINNFAKECLTNPTVAFNGINDPQYKQFKAILQSKATSHIKLLDFGAGQGRFISSIADENAFNQSNLDYYAYDLKSPYNEQCKKSLEKYYKDPSLATTHFFDNIQTLTANHKHKFDIILLSNVLHEIDCKEWEKTFTDISELLNPNGCLMIIEDCLIPVGELPTANGFVVLSTEEFSKLFNLDDSKIGISDYNKTDNKYIPKRLMAHLIPASSVANVSKSTINAALTTLREHSKKEIQGLRQGSSSTYKKGMAHAFWLFEMANAEFYLDELTK